MRVFFPRLQGHHLKNLKLKLWLKLTIFISANILSYEKMYSWVRKTRIIRFDITSALMILRPVVDDRDVWLRDHQRRDCIKYEISQTITKIEIKGHRHNYFQSLKNIPFFIFLKCISDPQIKCLCHLFRYVFDSLAHSEHKLTVSSDFHIWFCFKHDRYFLLSYLHANYVNNDKARALFTCGRNLSVVSHNLLSIWHSNFENSLEIP
jgi:hypothetical protein